MAKSLKPFIKETRRGRKVKNPALKRFMKEYDIRFSQLHDDFDRDGQSNYDEFLGGTNPRRNKKTKFMLENLRNLRKKERKNAIQRLRQKGLGK